MKQKHFCQSCGMPMQHHDDFGTNTDNSLNEDYCIYCYRDGSFTADCSMEEMIEQCLTVLDEYNLENNLHYTPDEARAGMMSFFPTLKRWKEKELVG